MNNNSSQKEPNSEIDLFQVSNSLKNGFYSSLKVIPFTINFIKQYAIILIGLVIIGGVSGFFYNKYTKQYESNIIVTPNFDTIDYLNQKIAQFNTNLLQRDTMFLNKVGVDQSLGVFKIEVTPIDDLYKFLNQEDKYYDIFKTLSENNDAKKVADDPSTSKYFAKHLITVGSKRKIDTKTLDNIVQYLNSSEFYQVYRVEILKNIQDKMVVNDSTIKQIDQILKKSGSSTTNSSTLSLNNDSQLNDLVKEKLKMIEENHRLKVHQHNLKYIITPLNYTENIIVTSGFNGKYHLIFPFILIGLFVMIKLIKRIK